MSGDLISRSALLDTILGHFGVDLAYFGEDLQFCQEAIAFAPAVEAEPVIHAYWKLRGGLFRCTRCDAKALWSKNGGTHGYSYEYEQVKAKRCHMCGAHMDEEAADA